VPRPLRQPIRSVFLSHAGGHDDEWTRWVEVVLQELGFVVEVDYSSFGLGEQLAQRISQALDRCQACVCLFSESYFEKGRWTGTELAGAWSAKLTGKVEILPFEIEHVQIPGLYESMITRKLYELTESAARKAITDEFNKLGAGAGRWETQPGSVDGRPHYPGPKQGSLRTHLFGGTAQVENLIAESEQLAHDVALITDLAEMHMAELMTATQSLARSYNHWSPAEILRTALPGYQNTTAALEGSHSPKQLAELQYVRGRLHAILAYATLDLGRDSVAGNHARAVIRCADYAGHGELKAWGIGTLAMILRFQGRNEQSVAEALNGLGLRVSGASAARLHAQAALSYVELGDVSSSTEHLKASDDKVDSPPESPEMRDGIFLFSRAKHHYYAGSAYADFGNAFAGQAVTESEQAIDGLSTGDLDVKSYSDELLAYVHLARGLYMAGRLEEIPQALRVIFSTDPDYRTSWHIQWLDRLVVSLNRGRSRGSAIAGEIERSVSIFKEELVDSSGPNE
jgi:TIR domain-containing protein